MRRLLTTLAAVALLGAVVPVSPVAAEASDCESITGNLVANCGFESYTQYELSTDVTWSSWSDSSSDGWAYMETTTAHTGDAGMRAGPMGVTEWIEQDLITAAGTEYLLRFYVRGGAEGTQTATFTATLDGATAYSRTNTDPALPEWILVEYAFTASDTSTTLRFTFQNEPDWWYVDDVSFVEASGDLTPPTLTLAQKAGQADPTKISPVNFALVANELLDPATVSAADLEVTNGTIGTIDCSGTPTTCTIPVTPTGDGGVTIAPSAAFSVKDLAGNAQTAAGGTDRSITYDTTPPVITASPKVRGLNVTITIVANETATWDCRLGTSGTWVEDCGSPWTTSSLPKGTYTLYLRGADTLGNIAEESSITFTIKSGKKTGLN